LTCLDASGNELDLDGDGYGCLDCNDGDAAVHPGAAEVCDGRDADCSGRTDDAPACGCEPTTIEGHTFQLCDQPMPWSEAAAFCQGMGLTLARVEDRALARALQREAKRTRDDRWWIGLSDRDQEGVFAWSDGAPLAEVPWARRQPDNGTCNQDCAAFGNRGRGTLQDTHCGQHLPFICR
jgi:hypothetical protein